MQFHKQTLANGLEVVAECNPQAHSTAFGFFVRTGARDETDAVSGVSHFLEHMVFKGTPTRSADDVNREFDEMGAYYNAFTSEENTVYYAAVLPEFQDRVVQLWTDILRPSLREEDFDTEKKVILEEIQMYEDQPPFGADDKCRATHYGTHPLGKSVLGTAASVDDLPVEAMRDYFRRRYSPGNITLVGAGRVDFEELVRSAQRYCGDWEPVVTARDSIQPQPQAGFQVIRKAAATQEYAVTLALGPAADDRYRHAAQLLAAVIGDDTGSRLFWELVDPGLAEHASLHHYEYDDAGLMMTYLSCDPGRAAENLQRILDVYRRVQTDEPVTAEELAQARSKLSSRTVLSGERPRGRLFSVGSDWIQRREYCSIRHDLDALAAVTPEQVADLLARFPLAEGTTVVIGPLADVAAPK